MKRINNVLGYCRASEYALLKDQTKPDRKIVHKPDYQGCNLEDLVRTEEVDFEDVDRLTAEDGKMRHLAQELFGEEIESLALDKGFHYHSTMRFSVTLKGHGVSQFYVKKSWERVWRKASGLREVVGIELSNILSPTSIRYLYIGNNVYLMEHVGEALYGGRCSLLAREFPQIWFNLGMASEYSRVLGLRDRSGHNVVVNNEGQVINIDFGTVFSKKSFHEDYFSDFLYNKRASKSEYEEGKRHAVRLLKQNMRRHLCRVVALCTKVEERFGLKALDVVERYCRERGMVDLQRQLQRPL